MFEFVRYCQERHIPAISEGHHHCHQGWIQTHCFLCAGGRDGFHLGFSTEKGNLNCWRCGPVKLVDFIRHTARISVDAAHRLRREYDSQERRIVVVKRRTRRVKGVPPGLAPLDKIHRSYLRSRGLENIKELAKLWDLQGTKNLSLDWNWRVVAPIMNEEAETVAYVGRSILPKVKVKYRVTEDKHCVEDPEGFLYGIHKLEDEERILVVEGPGDVWKVGPGSVATMGISWRQLQVNKLRRFKRRYIMYDPEEEAQRQATRLAEALSIFPGETEVIDGLKSDPGDLSYRRVRKIRKALGFKGDIS